MTTLPPRAQVHSLEAYRDVQRAWVSDLKGGGMGEIALVTSIGLVTYFLWRCLLLRGLIPWRQDQQGPFNALFTLLAEGSLLVLPSLICYTYADWAPQLIGSSLLLGLLILALPFSPSSSSLSSKRPQDPPPTLVKGRRLAWLTAYRSSMMLMTCIAILAVDFTVFPRRFAKVETFGTSLMDLGVGSVVYSAGLVASRQYMPTTWSRISPPRLALNALKDAFPLVILGLARLAFVKGAAYQEHVSEYGVHWNFFLTLSGLPIGVALCKSLFAQRAGLAACVVALAYQYILSYMGLQSFILEAPRSLSLFAANKEGISSLMGYLAIYLFGVDSGQVLLEAPGFPTDSPKMNRSKSWRLLARIILLWSCLYFALHSLDLPVSRRMANLPYVLWVVAFNLTFVLGFCLTEMGPFSTTSLKDVSPELLSAVNQNSLFIFLLANILTGTVNTLVWTLYVPEAQAMLILSLYMGLVSLVALVLYRHHIRWM
ncbi:MAG: GWT1-domain-containing protein [Piptocephalis tieghemiana]|nr:MAG: GWT1-domain-containing protein [Piptocephalis tieghemiana]